MHVCMPKDCVRSSPHVSLSESPSRVQPWRKHDQTKRAKLGGTDKKRGRARTRDGRQRRRRALIFSRAGQRYLQECERLAEEEEVPTDKDALDSSKQNGSKT